MTKSIAISFVGLACVIGGALSQTTAYTYGQCGGIGWTGPTICPTGWTCTYTNPWYSQCLPGAGSTIATSTTTTTAVTSPPITTPTTTTPSSTTTETASTGIPTLVAGWNFIRAVTAPNFHKYLQSEITNSPGDAILGEATTAAQFKITNGQLIHSVGGTNLYAVVAPRTDAAATKLKVLWSKTPDTLGTFKFSGDTVEWSSTTISRPQTNAWLICADAEGHKDVYINLGSYGYQTPSGCNDHTIHGFTGTTPD